MKYRVMLIGRTPTFAYVDVEAESEDEAAELVEHKTRELADLVRSHGVDDYGLWPDWQLCDEWYTDVDEIEAYDVWAIQD